MERVGAAIIEVDGKILIAKRKKGDDLEHKWEFPGGTVEKGETPEECIERELMEEFGIQVQVEEFFSSNICEYEYLKIELLVYKVTYLSGKILLNEHEEIKWVTPPELDGYDFAQADIPIAQEIRQRANADISKSC